MGPFSRRRRDDNVENGHAATSTGTSNRHVSSSTYSMATRPSFGQWLKVTWVDILTFIIMGAIGLGIYEAPPAPTRSFPVTFADGEVVYPQFAYPLRKEIIPIWLAAFLAAAVPIIAILVMQIRVRSFWDVNNGIIGLLYSLIGAAVFQVFVKFLIGGLRPHFLDVCKPDVSLAAGGGASAYDASGFKQLYYTPDICTGNPKEINDSLESFPSGHSTAAFAGFVYLYLYLNAKLKVFANYHAAMWKMIVIYIPILGAVLIAGALTIDEYHNWYDVCAGAIIGTVMAFSSYRMCYAAIWDWRWNHVPLNRHQACLYTHDGELMDAMWTRKAGWGQPSSSDFGNNHHHHHLSSSNGGRDMYGSSSAGGGAGHSIPRKAVGVGHGRDNDIV